MKFNIEVECTPEEARTFLGLPDVVPIQTRLMAEMEERLREVARDYDPKALLDQWMPFGMKGMDQLQSLWAQMAMTAAGLQTLKDKDKPKKG